MGDSFHGAARIVKSDVTIGRKIGIADSTVG
jgi:hypothetical protein